MGEVDRDAKGEHAPPEPDNERRIPRPPVNRVLDERYELLEEIGRGAAAVVYRATVARLFMVDVGARVEIDPPSHHSCRDEGRNRSSLSRPTWRRGSKSTLPLTTHVEARIEIDPPSHDPCGDEDQNRPSLSRPTWRRGLKSILPLTIHVGKSVVDPDGFVRDHVI
jgi:hypothetical protein